MKTTEGIRLFSLDGEILLLKYEGPALSYFKNDEDEVDCQTVSAIVTNFVFILDR